MRSFADVAPRETMLLSRQPYLVYGDVALIYGAGSLGKGRLVASIVADVTNGRPVGLDESAEDDAGDVVVVLPEDKTDESAVRRLVAAGANLRRCWDMTRLPSGTRFKLSASDRHPGHLPELRAAVEQLRANGGNPRLVVIDPIGACIGEGTIQTSKGARVLIESLQDFAEATGVCVLLVAHPVSNGKLQGSHALEQALRAVFYVRRDQADASLRILACVKGNDVPPEYAGDIRFTIVDGADGPRAEWVTSGQAAPSRGQARPDWRDELAARRAAKAAPGTPAAAPARPQAGFTVTVASRGGTRILAQHVADLGRAWALCAATPEAKALEAAGQPLQWRQASATAWQAGNRAIGFAVVAEQAGRAAV